MPKPPDYLIELARQAGGKVLAWKEYPELNQVAVILTNGRKFTFPMPTAGKTKTTARHKAKPRKETNARKTKDRSNLA